MTGHDRAVGIIWSLCVVVLIASLVAGFFQVLETTTAQMAYRWVMALLFLGGSLAWLTVYHQNALRRFFKR